MQSLTLSVNSVLKKRHAIGLPVGSDVVATTRSELQDYPSATVYISHIQTHNLWNIFVSILSEYCDHYF